MSSKSRPWEESNWVRGEMLPTGNQGHTFLARRGEDPPDEFNYVLKTLKRQDCPVRRKRFFVEAQSLRVIDFDGVAKLIDTNADKFADSKTELYVVTERIQGPDLTRFAQLPVNLNVAVEVVSQVLQIVGKCHEIGVRHRDIKPCHVILRDAKTTDPVLIDFGLAFNEELELDDSTETIEGVGNRFLILWEQLHGHDKRDHRSDLTQCVGVLFYLVTGKTPGIAIDSNLKRPHDKLDLASATSNINDQQLIELKRIFDVGFELNRDQRWQCAADLIAELDRLVRSVDGASGETFGYRIAEVISAAKQNPEVEWHRQGQLLLKLIVECTQERASQIERECQSLVKLSRVRTAPTETEVRLSWTLSTTMVATKPKTFILRASRKANILALSAFFTEQGRAVSVELLRARELNVVDPSTRRISQEFVEEAWIKLLSHALATPADNAIRTAPT